MKRFLDKTWAKVAAFILFFVFLGLSIAGSVGIYFLAANDVYLAGSEASRQILYDGQASDVMTTVIDGLYNCSDKEALRDWLLVPAGERLRHYRDQYRHRRGVLDCPAKGRQDYLYCPPKNRLFRNGAECDHRAAGGLYSPHL